MDCFSKGYSSKTLIFFIALAFVGALFLLLVKDLRSLFQAKSLSKSDSSSIIPIPSPTNAQTTDVHSSDGTMELIMQREEKEKGLADYSFSVSDIAGVNKKPIFSKTLKTPEKMSISPNSWSPDNKYFYLLESKDGMFTLK